MPVTSEVLLPAETTARRYSERFPWADQDAIEAFLAISQTFNALRLALSRSPLPGGAGLSRAQHNFLAALSLAEGNKLPLSEIAREMNVTPTYVTKLLDSLEDEGLVARSASPSDRRVTFACLTAEGLARCKSLVPAFLRFMEDVGSELSNEDKLQLRRLLARYVSRADSILAGLQTD
jgi:DNA-binding MarR family transcriptional regulator